MEAKRSSDITANFFKAERYHNPEDTFLHKQHPDNTNLKKEHTIKQLTHLKNRRTVTTLYKVRNYAGNFPQLDRDLSPCDIISIQCWTLCQWASNAFTVIISAHKLLIHDNSIFR